MPKRVHNNTRTMRPPILMARPGVTTILRRPPTRSKPKEKNSYASRTNSERDGAGGPVEAGEGPSSANRTIARLSARGRHSDPGRAPAGRVEKGCAPTRGGALLA